MTKVVFMGTPELAVKPLQALILHPDFEVIAVVTQEDKKVGRKQILTPPPVKVAAEEHNIPVLQPPTLKNNEEFQETMEKLAPDFFVVVAYGQILPAEILEIPNEKPINIHFSLLPQYRGASPIESAFLANDQETGITFIEMTEKMDAGPILHLERVDISKEDNAETMREKLSTMSGQLVPTVLQDILDGVATPIQQDESHASYCHKISKEDGMINLQTMTAQEIHNRVRAYIPWPSCFLSLGDKKLKLIEIDVEESNATQPGKVIDKEEGIAIETKAGLIILKKVQLQGKREMDIQDFLRGNRSLFNESLTTPK
ncbi:methionyl-tRNA formyltransferase [Candidatus Peregrinibacteria bacterium]|nr:methionyl-tRNA formyltransferase [Candidatus Peregrinibacteria bacterium]